MAELFKVNAPVRKPLFEGVQGENEARSIQFDITPWVEELGDGAVTATAKRSQDSQPYPVTVTKDGTTVTWKPTSTDTAFAGVGSFQLEYTVGGVLAKTCIWSTMVAPSLDPAGDPPDPYENWLAEMRQIAAEALQHAQDAEQSAQDAEQAADDAAASAEGADATVSNVRSDIDALSNEVFEDHTVITTTSMQGARLKSDGSVVSSGLFDVTSMIPAGNNSYISIDYTLTPEAGYGTIVIGYYSDNSISSANLVGYEETSVENEKYNIPSGAKYIGLTCPMGTHPTVTLYESKVVDIENRTAVIESELIETASITTTTYLPDARITTSAGMTSSGVYDITNFVNVDGWESVSVDYSSSNASTCIIGYFSADSITSANLVGYENSVVAGQQYSVLGGAKYIALSCPKGTHPVVTLYKKRLDSLESEIDDLKSNFERGTVARADSMTTGESVSATVGNLKKNTVLGFTANITTFGSLQIGQGRTINAESAYLVIDNTNITVYTYYGSAAHVEGTYAHGLTIADYLDVCIEESNDEIGYAKIRATSNGNTYTIDRVRWIGYNKTVYADAISGDYSNCLLSYYCADYSKDMWLFGDSYFDHWCTYCLRDGYSNFLCDGFSGRKSDDAFASLERNLNHGKPDTIVWCIGMNNGDTSSAVNPSWKTYYDKLVSLCSEKSINLILCTIPNVSSVNNNYKNAIIRSSGYRYIDLAKAVGSDISTSWFTGLLSSDGVHPSALGDEMIARFMESALPEIIK